MTTSYDPVAVLHAIDEHIVGVLALVGACGVATFAYLIASFRAATRDRAFPASIVAVGFFGIHDLSFVLNWSAWFSGPLSHWWTMTWCVALAATTVIEFALVYQVFRFGRAELAPRLGRRAFGWCLVASLVAIAALWAVVKSVLVDDLFLISFAITAWMGPVFSSVLVVRRGTRRAQTVGMAWCLVVIQVGMFSAWTLLDPWFRGPVFLTLGATAIVWSLVNVVLVRAHPPYVVPAGDQPAPSARISSSAA